VPAHAIGDHEKIEFFQDNERIFVVLSLEPNVRESQSDCPHQRKRSRAMTKRLSPQPLSVKEAPRTG